MDSQLEYPEDDLDSMLDDELEIMREIEEERNKENVLQQSQKLQETPNAKSPRGLKAIDTNVGIGKRTRSEEEDDLDLEGWSGVDYSPRKSNATKRLKTVEDENIEPARIEKLIPTFKERRVFRKLPDSEFQAITAEDGTRLYLKVKLGEEPVGVDKSGCDRQPVGLCGVPFHTLASEAVVESNRLATAAMERRELEVSHVEVVEETSLWVEKFRPKSYLELLSDDGTNRTLLTWLKLWDKIVFNRDKRVKSKEEPEAESKYKVSYLPDIIQELDKDNRPQQKVALLHGPPGLGKTTLAHIVARQAGYKVVEMNASDDRTVDAFKKKLEEATQMRSVIGGDHRPNCLIIDEIDGVPAPTINYLINVILGKQTSKKKNKSAPPGLLRPIICICNELYTPSLRPLRQHALTLPFPPTVASRLAARLRDITATEKLKTDMSALLALCKKTENDIRSCLSTLQFFKKRGKMLMSSDIAKTNVGTKDSQKSLFTVWDEIFSIPRAESSAAETRMVQPANSVPARYKSILQTVSSCGDYDKLVAGVFENYLSMKFKDCGMENVSHGMEWLCHFDLMHQGLLQNQAWILMGHFSFPLVMAHLLFGSSNKQRITFPTQQADCNAKRGRSENVLTSIVSEMDPIARVYASPSALSRELLPTILSVLQPSLRNVNTHLFSIKEKAELANVVAIHLSYCITYQQERNQETGQYEYRMDPDVESVVCFPGIKRSLNLSYGNKQLIAHEIEVEAMRRTEAQHSQPTAREPTEVTQGTPRGSKKTVSHLQKLEAKPIDLKPAVATDFFGRAIKVDPAAEKKKESNDIVKSDVWFKFREGYSNAVRRNVKMKDLL